ncbi:MAG TPA: hypothetical protein VG407_08085 [Caulobacteraceae bacterium]|jgi:hypothetical protein|nr:hypothetical protein [Caulobacteraceae bacterium]
MDIHKPKPWRGVREFLKEYLIIVVGVLTALAAEQTVEWLHWKERVNAAESRLKRELSGDYLIALERSMIVPCLDRRLAGLKTALLSGEGEWTPLPPMHGRSQGYKVFFVPNRIFEDQAWKSVEADGTASHIPPSANALYGRAYSTAAVFAGSAADEVVEVATLNLLSNVTRLPLPERLALISKIEQEQVRNTIAGYQSKQVMARIKATTRIDEGRAQAWVLTRSNAYNACSELGLLGADAPMPRLVADPAAAASMMPDMSLH